MGHRTRWRRIISRHHRRFAGHVRQQHKAAGRALRTPDAQVHGDDRFVNRNGRANADLRPLRQGFNAGAHATGIGPIVGVEYLSLRTEVARGLRSVELHGYDDVKGLSYPSRAAQTTQSQRLGPKRHA
jgi:hypothetical protein